MAAFTIKEASAAEIRKSTFTPLPSVIPISSTINYSKY
jgi:hypothetical protein